MSDRPTITTLPAGGRYSTEALNSNFQALRNQFDNVVGTSGVVGDNNSMTANFDMNNYNIINAGSILDGSGLDLAAQAGYAEEWANKAEDSLVSVAAGGDLVDDYSAKHFSIKASTHTAITAADVVLTNADVVSAGVSETNAAASAVAAAAAAAGIYWKAPCEVSSTANLTLSGEQTIDGVLTSGSRIVVRHQTAAAANGIYLTAAGAWARSAPMDTWDEHVGAVVLVNQGTAYANTAYQCTVTPGGTLDTTDITWSTFGAVAINQSVDNWADTTDYTSGTTTALTLTIDPGSENNCAVSFDGVMQHHDTYSVSGTTLTFDAAIPLGTANIEARYASSVGVGVPSDGTVTAVKLATDAVETLKIKDGNVTTVKIADDAVTGAKLNPALVAGDIIYADATDSITRLAKGSDTEVLTLASGVPSWAAAGGGKLVDTVYTTKTAGQSSTTVIPFDDTIPQNTEGDEIFTLTITPTSASNLLHIKFSGFFLVTGASVRTTFALFQDSTASALCATVTSDSADNGDVMCMDYTMVAGTTSATTFKIRFGPNFAATSRINQDSGGRKFGGVASTQLQLWEVEP